MFEKNPEHPFPIPIPFVPGPAGVERMTEQNP